MIDAHIDQASHRSATADESGSEAEDDDFKRLTADEAQALRGRLRVVSPRRVVTVQAVVGLVSAVLGGLLMQRWPVAMSMLYGAAAVVVPSGLMAWGMGGRPVAPQAGALAVRFMTWELVKIALTVVLLLMAPVLVKPLSWPALLVAMVLCMKVNWLALLWQGRSAKNI